MARVSRALEAQVVPEPGLDLPKNTLRKKRTREQGGCS